MRMADEHRIRPGPGRHASVRRKEVSGAEGAGSQGLRATSPISAE